MLQRYGLLQHWQGLKICLITCVFGHRVFLQPFCMIFLFFEHMVVGQTGNLSI